MLIKDKYLIIIITVLIARFCSAQVDVSEWWGHEINEKDSLLEVLDTASAENRINTLMILWNISYKVDPEESKQYAQECLEVSKKLNNLTGLGWSFDRYGFYFFVNNELDSALYYFEKSEEVFLGNGDNFGLYALYQHKSETYLLLRDYEMAASLLIKSLPQHLDLKKHKHVFMNARNIASMMKRIGKYNEEEKYLDLALQYADSTGIQKFIVIAISELGKFYRRMGDYSLAMKYYLQLNSFLESCKDKHRNYWLGQNIGRIASLYRYKGMYDSAIYYHDHSLRIFYELPDNLRTDVDINIGNQLEGKALVKMRQGRLIEAKSLIEKSIILRQKWNDILGYSMCLDVFGEIQMLSGDFEGAIQSLDTALKMKRLIYDSIKPTYSTANYTDYIATNIKLIGQVYQEWGEADQAEKYYVEALDICKNSNDIQSMAEIYTKLGLFYLESNDIFSAKDMFDKSWNIFSSIGDKAGMAVTYKNLAQVALKESNPAKAESLFKQALKLFRNSGILRDQPEILLNLAMIEKESRKFEDAIEHLQQGLKIARQNLLLMDAMKIHLEMSGVFESTGEIRQAFEHFRHYTDSKDSVYTIETNYQLNEIMTKYQAAEKEKKLELLNSQYMVKELQLERNKNILYSLAGLIILIILIVIIYFRLRSLRASQDKLLLEQRLLRSQMNPHFIFNALANIQSMIVQKDTVEASRYLSRFGKLVRNILDGSRSELVSLEQELSTIDSYLALQKLRHDDKFDYFIHVDYDIDRDTVRIPPMLLQPFVENSIEHGIRPLKRKGKIEIDISYMDKNEDLDFESSDKLSSQLKIVITDNGVGRKKASKLSSKESNIHNGVAISITRERLSVLTRKYGAKFELEFMDLYEDGQPGGTEVVLIIPV